MSKVVLMMILAAAVLLTSGCATMYPASHANEKARVCRPGSAIRYETEVPAAPGGLMRLAPPHGNCLYQ